MINFKYALGSLPCTHKQVQKLSFPGKTKHLNGASVAAAAAEGSPFALLEAMSKCINSYGYACLFAFEKEGAVVMLQNCLVQK